MNVEWNMEQHAAVLCAVHDRYVCRIMYAKPSIATEEYSSMCVIFRMPHRGQEALAKSYKQSLFRCHLLRVKRLCAVNLVSCVFFARVFSFELSEFGSDISFVVSFYSSLLYSF